VFAELADVTFMDAWLPEYAKDSMGTNLVITRSKIAENLLLFGVTDGEINMNNVSIDKIIQSQKGVIDVKRKQISYRLYLAQKSGLKVPEKRVHIIDNIGILNKREAKIKCEMQEASRSYFINNYQNNYFNIKNFRNDMAPHIQKIKFQNIIVTFINIRSIIYSKIASIF
jgi:hypothetical protein